MQQFKRARVVMLPVNKESKLFIIGNNLYSYFKPQEGDNCVELYIISDDEIKEGDWCYNFRDNIIEKYNSKDIHNLGKGYSKIIATTDTSLKEGVKYYDDGTPVTFNTYKSLPQPSQQFIKKYIEEYNKGNIITDILVEYEELYNDYGETELFDLVSTGHSKILKIKINPKDNTITIKKLKDSWNREEIIAIHKKNCERLTNSYTSEDIKWINQNL